MKTLLGGILMAIGILIAGASGLCSLTMLVSGGMASMASALPMVAVFGGIPFAAGVGLIFAGKALIDSARRDRGPWGGE